MATDIRELCIRNLKTTLEGITTGNGYAHTLRSVQRFQQSGQTSTETPYAIIVEGPERVEQGPNPLVAKFLSVDILVMTVQDEQTDQRSSDEVMNALRADVQRAVEVDFQRGGFAVDTIEVGNEPIDVQDGQPEIGTALRYEIHYRHTRGDPASL